MTVSWRPLSLTEAKGIVNGYTVTYSVSGSLTRQSNVQNVGPDISLVTITGLDANSAYTVGVTATNNAGTSTLITSPAPPPGEIMHVVVILCISKIHISVTLFGDFSLLQSLHLL